MPVGVAHGLLNVEPVGDGSVLSVLAVLEGVVGVALAVCELAVVPLLVLRLCWRGCCCWAGADLSWRHWKRPFTQSSPLLLDLLRLCPFVSAPVNQPSASFCGWILASLLCFLLRLDPDPFDRRRSTISRVLEGCRGALSWPMNTGTAAPAARFGVADRLCEALCVDADGTSL